MQLYQVFHPAHRDGKSVWRQGVDSAGEIDVAVIELDRAALPKAAVYRAFTPNHLPDPTMQIEVGSSLRRIPARIP